MFGGHHFKRTHFNPSLSEIVIESLMTPYLCPAGEACSLEKDYPWNVKCTASTPCDSRPCYHGVCYHSNGKAVCDCTGSGFHGTLCDLPDCSYHNCKSGDCIGGQCHCHV